MEILRELTSHVSSLTYVLFRRLYFSLRRRHEHHVHLPFCGEKRKYVLQAQNPTLATHSVGGLVWEWQCHPEGAPIVLVSIRRSHLNNPNNMSHSQRMLVTDALQFFLGARHIHLCRSYTTSRLGGGNQPQTVRHFHQRLGFFRLLLAQSS